MITVETFASADQVQGALSSDATYLGGGTLVMRALNYGQQDFERIVRCTVFFKNRHSDIWFYTHAIAEKFRLCQTDTRRG